MTRRWLAVATLLIVSISGSYADDSAPLDVTQRDVVAFIDEMVTEHGFDAKSLRATLSEARVKQSIIEKISTPAERRLSWGEYRKIFITRERIAAGTTFWLENRDMLERINRESGVSVEIELAIGTDSTAAPPSRVWSGRPVAWAVCAVPFT